MGQTHTNEAKFTHCAGSLDIDLVSFNCGDHGKSFPKSRDAQMFKGHAKTLKAVECHKDDKLTIYQGVARACEKNWKDDDCKKKSDFTWFDKQHYLIIGEQQFVYATEDNMDKYCDNRRFLSNEVEQSIARELLSEDACFEDSMDYQLNLYLDGDRTCFVADPGEDSGCAPFVMETEYPDPSGLPVKNLETYDRSTTPYDDLKGTHGYSPDSDLVLNFGSYTYNSIQAAFNAAEVETEELAGFDLMISNKGVFLKNIALELGVVPSLLEVELISDILANNFPEVVKEIMDEDRVPDEVKSMPGFEIVHWFLQETCEMA